jgi:hypothetical protein
LSFFCFLKYSNMYAARAIIRSQSQCRHRQFQLAIAVVTCAVRSCSCHHPPSSITHVHNNDAHTPTPVVATLSPKINALVHTSSHHYSPRTGMAHRCPPDRFPLPCSSDNCPRKPRHRVRGQRSNLALVIVVVSSTQLNGKWFVFVGWVKNNTKIPTCLGEFASQTRRVQSRAHSPCGLLI